MDSRRSSQTFTKLPSAHSHHEDDLDGEAYKYDIHARLYPVFSRHEISSLFSNSTFLFCRPEPHTKIPSHTSPTSSNIIMDFSSRTLNHAHYYETFPFMYLFYGNCAASVPISTFMCLWAIYILPGLAIYFPAADRSWKNINISQIYECRN